MNESPCVDLGLTCGKMIFRSDCKSSLATLWEELFLCDLSLLHIHILCILASPFSFSLSLVLFCHPAHQNWAAEDQVLETICEQKIQYYNYNLPQTCLTKPLSSGGISAPHTLISIVTSNHSMEISGGSFLGKPGVLDIFVMFILYKEIICRAN